jgi:hypothetical protein
MTYKDIEFVILAGLAAMAGVLLGSTPDNAKGPSVLQFNGSREDAIASAQQRID